MVDLSKPLVLLSLIIFLPTAAALVICLMPKGREELIKRFALLVTVAVFLLTAWMAIPSGVADEDSARFALETDRAARVLI